MAQTQFLCALSPATRPKWAQRMSQLLDPKDGRLICLEWPLHKSPDTGGPPWGLSPEIYSAHLGRPGHEIAYTDDGRVAETVSGVDPVPGALVRLDRLKPTRTHKSGCDDQGNVLDFVSVWAHR
jgi:hypothetical protein